MLNYRRWERRCRRIADSFSSTSFASPSSIAANLKNRHSQWQGTCADEINVDVLREVLVETIAALIPVVGEQRVMDLSMLVQVVELVVALAVPD